MANILISGAGIAGPALAYWLSTSGHDVTVVERADAVRPEVRPWTCAGRAAPSSSGWA